MNYQIKIFWTLLFCASFAFMSKATTNKVDQDSSYFSLQDTIFITLGADLEKFVLHEMQPKQTLFSLAQFFGLRSGDLLDYNIELGEDIYKVGAVIQVPIPNSAIVRFANERYNLDDYIPLVYTVKNGETLYRIAKQYFKMPVNVLQTRNNISNFEIKQGQKLHVGWIHKNGIKKSSYRFKGAKTNFVLTQYLDKYGYKKIEEQTGVGAWQKNTDTKGLYALHNKAKINSEIAVTNPMSKRTVLVKVIGRIPAAAFSKDEIVVLSSQAAKTLRLLDERSLVNVHYWKR